MKSVRNIILATLLIMTTGIFCSCDDGVLTSRGSTFEDYLISPGILTLDKNRLNLELNGSDILTARYVWYGKESNDITWTSSDPRVVTVDNSGRVTTVGLGTATITVKSNADSNYYDECLVNVINSNGHAYVDLGLPSGTLWATEDVMGKSVDGRKSGYLFAWGELNVKDEYTEANYTYTDKPGILPLDHDVANVNWGGSWRMPTDEEFRELLNHTGNKITTIQGQKYNVRDNIMFPLTEVGQYGSYSTYWSSVCYRQQRFGVGYSYYDDYDYDKATYFTVGEGSEDSFDYSKYVGHRIRAVCTYNQRDSESDIDIYSIKSKYICETMKVGDVSTLNVEILPTNATTGVDWVSSNPRVATVDANGVVTALSNGTTDITATSIKDVYKKATCTVVVSEKLNDHEYVDLGLTSGTQWAICNLGANSPVEGGDRFAWGMTNLRSYNFTESNYTYKDNPPVLPLERDAAYVRWGENWRMPTQAEFEELCDECTWELFKVDLNNYCCKVTSKKNGNVIYIPASTGSYGTSLSGWPNSANYWSSTIREKYNDYAFELYIKHEVDYYGYCSEFSYSATYAGLRYYGRSIRPVLNTNQ